MHKCLYFNKLNDVNFLMNLSSFNIVDGPKSWDNSFHPKDTRIVLIIIWFGFFLPRHNFLNLEDHCICPLQKRRSFGRNYRPKSRGLELSLGRRSIHDFLFFFFSIYLFIFIWLCKSLLRHLGSLIFSCYMWDPVPWPAIEPGPPTLGVQNVTHWTTREVPWLPSLGFSVLFPRYQRVRQD